VGRNKERGPNRFREAEVARAVRTALKGGAKIKNIIVKPDEVRIECGEEDQNEDKDRERWNRLTEELKRK
jgi:hypothetical protein